MQTTIRPETVTGRLGPKEPERAPPATQSCAPTRILIQTALHPRLRQGPSPSSRHQWASVHYKMVAPS